MKRFTETEKWSDPWFRKLTANGKLGYLYLLDRVDNSGVIDIDRDLADFQIGTAIDWDALIHQLGERIEVLPCGKWHLTRFVSFQFGELRGECKPHAQVIRLQHAHGIGKVSVGYPKGIDTLQDKDKDKEKDKDTNKALPDLPASLITPAFTRAWGDWLTYRRERKLAAYKATTLKRQLAALEAWGEAAAVAAIDASIRNNWQGIFEPKAGNGAPAKATRAPAETARVERILGYQEGL